MTFIESIDWNLAEKIGHRTVSPGPKVDLAEAIEVTEGLKAAALLTPKLIAEFTELPLARDAEVKVVDRTGWVTESVETFSTVIGGEPATTPADRITAKTFGTQFGLFFGFIAGRILGEFDPYGASPKLLLVGPNVVKVARKLEVEMTDFQLWVCLHEQTHQAQFAAAPWLPKHLIGLAFKMVDGEMSGFRQLLATMSVLEGHADVMMDKAGPEVIPTLNQIRTSFDKYRYRGGLAGLLNLLTGMKMKLEQYRKGARFCNQVIAEAGLVGFNRVFECAENMPTSDEIEIPKTWVTRVLG